MRNGEITFYAINVVEVATGTLTLWNTSDHFLTVEPLHPYYEYQVSVAAATVGLGPYSPERIVRMPEAGQWCYMEAQKGHRILLPFLSILGLPHYYAMYEFII